MSISPLCNQFNLRYVHDEVGYNYRLVNVLAAIGVAQMENLDYILKSKLETAVFYNEHFSPVQSIQFEVCT